MAEADFRRWLVRNVPDKSLIQSIETCTGAGVPDVFLCFRGSPCWIELKETLGSPTYMRTTQWRWFTRLVDAGGIGFLIVKRVKTKTIDIYDAERLVGKDIIKRSRISGQKVIFDPDMKPDRTVEVCNGAKYFYKVLAQLIKRKEK